MKSLENHSVIAAKQAGWAIRRIAFRSLTFAALSISLAGAAQKENPPGLRLPDTVRPVRYSADLTIVPGKETFQGKIDIDLDVRAPQETLWLNARDLSNLSAQLNDSPARLAEGPKGVIGLTPERRLAPGTAKLHIEYSGKIDKNSSAGVFQLQQGSDWYVYTQFEATDARRAFPCFDEPSFKVPWQVTLRAPKGQMVLSNTPEEARGDAGGGLEWVRFQATRPLPSYLIAFAVGPFEALDAGASSIKKAPLRIIVPRGRTGEATFVAQAVPQMLKLLEEYFGSPYPYEKLDSIVMPIGTFAMENVGLITYGQSLLLAKPEDDTIRRKRLRAMVVAHEMAHQWFGDLVTASWWDDIWLNEAFATWLGSKVVGRWKPEWHSDVSNVENRLRAMNLDSLTTARKIRQPIESEGDIANIFDGITYQKGAAVIGMFEHWLGEERFRKGVQLYMRRHADRNATARDFLADISKGAGTDVSREFSTFLDQPGVPVISVELKCDRNAPRLAVRQQRSLPLGSPGSADQEWMIPVCVEFDAGGQMHSQCDLLRESSVEMKLNAKSCPTRVFANAGQAGYYRVSYGGDLLRKLVGRKEHLSTAEKVGLLGDVQALVRSGEIPAAEAMAMVPEFAKDPSQQVVSGTIELAAPLAPYEIPEDLAPKEAVFIRSVYGRQAHEMGWSPKPGETDDDKLLRQELMSFVAKRGEDQELIAQAEGLAREWLKDRKGIDPNMLDAVLRTAAQFGDRALFDALLQTARASKDPRDRERLINALGSFGNPELARAAMGLLLRGEFDLRESFHPLLFSPLQLRETAKLPFEFVQENLDALLKVLPHDAASDLAASLVVVGNGFCDEQGAAQVDRFFRNRVREWAGGERRLANTLENILLCSTRRSQILPSVAEFLQRH